MYNYQKEGITRCVNEECYYMEIVFINLCVAIGICIPCSVSYIHKFKTARLVSTILLVFAITLLIVGIVLFAVTEKFSYNAHEICAMCAGYGIVPTGEQCLACQGAGKILVTTTAYTISLLYPICMTALGLYIIILRLALKESLER